MSNMYYGKNEHKGAVAIIIAYFCKYIKGICRKYW